MSVLHLLVESLSGHDDLMVLINHHADVNTANTKVGLPDLVVVSCSLLSHFAQAATSVAEEDFAAFLNNG